MTANNLQFILEYKSETRYFTFLSIHIFSRNTILMSFYEEQIIKIIFSFIKFISLYLISVNSRFLRTISKKVIIIHSKFYCILKTVKAYIRRLNFDDKIKLTFKILTSLIYFIKVLLTFKCIVFFAYSV